MVIRTTEYIMTCLKHWRQSHSCLGTAKRGAGKGKILLRSIERKAVDSHNFGCDIDSYTLQWLRWTVAPTLLTVYDENILVMDYSTSHQWHRYQDVMVWEQGLVLRRSVGAISSDVCVGFSILAGLCLYLEISLLSWFHVKRKFQWLHWTSAKCSIRSKYFNCATQGKVVW